MAEITNSLKQKAYETILGRILSQELLPGDILNRRTVAGDLGMSTAPVLEAMLQLDAEGFLETLPRKVTRVRIVRPADVRGMWIVREALECQGARLCCGEPVRRELPRLKRLAERLEADWQMDSLVQWQAELELHRAFMELAGCPALLQTFDKFMSRAFFFLVNQVMPAPVVIPPPHHSHLTLVQVLCTFAPDAAEAVMREHIRLGKTLKSRFESIQSLANEKNKPSRPTSRKPMKKNGK